MPRDRAAFSLQFCSQHGFSSKELLLTFGFCKGGLGMFSPLPTLGAVFGLWLGAPMEGLCQRCPGSRAEVIGIALRVPCREAPSKKPWEKRQLALCLPCHMVCSL